MADVVTRFKVARVESRRHLDWLKTLPCTWPGCQDRHVDPHHLRFVGPEEPAGMGITAGDRWAIPICRRHHDAAHVNGIHKIGQEAWAAASGVDLKRRCQHLWSIGPERGHSGKDCLTTAAGSTSNRERPREALRRRTWPSVS